MFDNQKGAIPILIIMAIIGLVTFLVVLQAAPLKNKLFSSILSTSLLPANGINYYGNNVATFGLFGQKDIGSATRNSVSKNAAYHGSGVIVDTSSTPNKTYFVDSGNNRILGFNGGDGSGKPADLVIGQPSMNVGTCNGDDNLGFKKAPTNATLCLMAYPIGNNTAEQWGGSNIDVDSAGNLYVADRYNNRVLEFYQPFSSDKTNGKGDAIADVVWGQNNFTSNGPNRSSSFFGTLNPPDDHSLNLSMGYGNPTAVGVSVDPFDKGIWVADYYNNRILHFPQNSPNADVVLGQPNMTTTGCNSDPTNSTRMCSPIIARVDPDSHDLYVIDIWPQGFQARFMVFHPDSSGHFQNGQAAARIFKPNVPRDPLVNAWMFDANGNYIFKSSGFVFNKDKKDYPTGLIWVNEHEKFRTLLLDQNGNVVATLGAKDIYHAGRDSAYSGCPTTIYQGNKVAWPTGSIGQDSANNLYFADEDSARVIRYSLPYLTYQYNGTICPPEGNASMLQRGWNLPSSDTLGESVGLAVFRNQLIVQDDKNTRKVWNNYTNKSFGAPADLVLTGWMAGRTLMSSAIDDSNRLWTYGEHGQISVYQLPFQTSNDQPIADYVKLYWIDDGTQLNVTQNYTGIAFDKINKKIYFVDSGGSRILRVSNYNNLLSGKLNVDMVIGQTNKTNTACNQGLSTPAANTLCQVYQIKFDNLGNLYAVDDNYECQGNRRITVFMASDLKNATGLFPNLAAQRVFNSPNFTSTPNCSPWVTNSPGTPVTIAFNNRNQMVVGNDGYYGDTSQRELKQLWFYSDPLNKQTPDASINLYMGTPGEMVFDSNDNLLIQDHTWYKVVMINLCTDPSWLSWLSGVNHMSACATPSCKPRPACLNARFACKMPEPVEGWCPSPTPTPSSTSLPTCKPRPACLDATPPCKLPEPVDSCP